MTHRIGLPSTGQQAILSKCNGVVSAYVVVACVAWWVFVTLASVAASSSFPSPPSWMAFHMGASFLLALYAVVRFLIPGLSK